MGAILLAGSMSALAQEATSAKGVQQLRDIPQSVTVVTERLIDERHLDSSVVMMKKGA